MPDPVTPETPPANEPANTAPKPPAAPPDYAALQADFAKTQEQLKQAVSAIAAMQAEQQAKETPPPPPEPEITPEFQTQAQAWFQKQIAPFLQEMRATVQAQAGWQAGQQLRQAAQEIDLPAELETEVQNLMAAYANGGKPINHQTALAHVLGNREIQRLKQEMATRRAKSQFNGAILPTFSGGGGLPNLTPNGVKRPADNDIAGWAKFADDHDMPLS